MKRFISLIIMGIICSSANAQDRFSLTSPDKNVDVTINVNASNITYTVNHGETLVIADSEIALELEDKILGHNPKLRNSKTNTVDEIIESPFYKKDKIRNHYNSIILNFKDNFSIEFRAYDEGVAYRFSTNYKGEITIKNEIAEFNFDKDYKSYIPYVSPRKQDYGTDIEKQFLTSFEAPYTVDNLSNMYDERLSFLPILVELDDNKKAVITESDLEDYPGMFLMKSRDCNYSLEGVYATAPKTEIQGGHNMLQLLITERQEYIAKTDGKRTFPWRIITISEEDYQLTDNDMVYKLASPSRVEDISWIKPGKVAWEWWNAWNISGVPFESGINNDTYKFYIDFASKNNIEYVILDEGWAVNKQADLFQVVEEIDLEALVEYATAKNVGIVLWAGYYAMERDMENVCRHYSEMGIKGFKVDFMDRDDQKVVNFYYDMAETAAKYKMFIDFHGAYKPTGMCRTYPNVLNFEGVWGLEQAKWIPNSYDLVTYEVTIPFIRQVAGYLDFTQGAMKNATRDNFRSVYTEPMSQGTRCRQLAEYVVFESPFNMLCDSPVNYSNNQECTDFISSVPTTWDETVALDGKVGEYVVIARRKGNTWYIGAINNWTPIDLTIDIAKLGNFSIYEAFEDGVNAHKIATDYTKSTKKISDNKINIHMAPGGGAAIIIER